MIKIQYQFAWHTESQYIIKAFLGKETAFDGGGSIVDTES